MSAQLPPGIELQIDGEVVRVQGEQSAQVESKSHPGEWHAVELIRDEAGTRYACTCRGFEIRKSCRHVRAIGRWMAGMADVRFRQDPSDD